MAGRPSKELVKIVVEKLSATLKPGDKPDTKTLNRVAEKHGVRPVTALKWFNNAAPQPTTPSTEPPQAV